MHSCLWLTVTLVICWKLQKQSLLFIKWRLVCSRHLRINRPGISESRFRTQEKSDQSSVKLSPRNKKSRQVSHEYKLAQSSWQRSLLRRNGWASLYHTGGEKFDMFALSKDRQSCNQAWTCWPRRKKKTPSQLPHFPPTCPFLTERAV